MSTKAAKSDVYQIVTDQIIEQLEKGSIPWNKPWTGYGLPKNYVTGNPYRGLNVFLLHMLDFEVPYYLTFNQVKQLGGKVIKGSKASLITYYNFRFYFRETPESKPTYISEEKAFELKKEGKEVFKKGFLKYYKVFNIEQIEGIDFDIPEVKQFDTLPIEECQLFCSSYMKNEGIKFNNNDLNRAFYRPSDDSLNMPEISQFKKSEEYYSTLFHEMAHSTGHKKRLNREDMNNMFSFGDRSYSKEELTAEMTAAFLCADFGLIPATIENSAAYIQGWLKKLKNDKNFVHRASSQAAKASDYIHSSAQVPN